MSYRIDIGGTTPLECESVGWSSIRRGDFATIGSNVTWAITSAVEGHASVTVTYEVVRSTELPTWRGRRGWLTHTEHGKSSCKYWRQVVPNVT